MPVVSSDSVVSERRPSDASKYTEGATNVAVTARDAAIPTPKSKTRLAKGGLTCARAVEKERSLASRRAGCARSKFNIARNVGSLTVAESAGQAGVVGTADVVWSGLYPAPASVPTARRCFHVLRRAHASSRPAISDRHCTFFGPDHTTAHWPRNPGTRQPLLTL